MKARPKSAAIIRMPTSTGVIKANSTRPCPLDLARPRRGAGVGASGNRSANNAASGNGLRLRGASRENVALNGLVSTGVIAGFRTNYATKEEPDQLQITVTSPSGAREKSIRAKVLQALGEIGKGAKIVIEHSGRQDR